MKKRPRKNDKFTVTEVGTLIEAMRSEFMPYLELLPVISKQLDRLLELLLKSNSACKDFELLEKKVASLAP
jgi:hypothetical protein